MSESEVLRGGTVACGCGWACCLVDDSRGRGCAGCSAEGERDRPRGTPLPALLGGETSTSGQQPGTEAASLFSVLARERDKDWAQRGDDDAGAGAAVGALRSSLSLGPGVGVAVGVRLVAVAIVTGLFSSPTRPPPPPVAGGVQLFGVQGKEHPVGGGWGGGNPDTSYLCFALSCSSSSYLINTPRLAALLLAGNGMGRQPAVKFTLSRSSCATPFATCERDLVVRCIIFFLTRRKRRFVLPLSVGPYPDPA